MFELVDLRDYPLPLLDEPKSPLWAPSGNEVAQRWSSKIADLDGFIFVTAEYNHSVPGALKNAIDYVAHVFAKKPAAYVGYGGVGAAGAIEQLRLINVEQQMAPLKSAVHIAGADFIDLSFTASRSPTSRISCVACRRCWRSWRGGRSR